MAIATWVKVRCIKQHAADGKMRYVGDEYDMIQKRAKIRFQLGQVEFVNAENIFNPELTEEVVEEPVIEEISSFEEVGIVDDFSESVDNDKESDEVESFGIVTKRKYKKRQE